VFDFDTPVDRSGTGSHKWDRYEGRDVIPLWVADSDFRAAPAVLDALEARVAHGVFGYTHVTQELEQVVCAHLLRSYDWAVRPDWLVWMPGVVPALNVLCRAIGRPADQIVTFTPVYPPLMSAPVLAGRELIKVCLAHRNGRYQLDLNALEAAITPSTKLLLLCSPHNPVGRVWSRDELADLMQIAKRHDLVVGSDDIHAGLVLDEDKRHTPVATLSEDAAARTVTLMSPSKTFNIAGLGCAFAVISDAGLRAAFCRRMQGIMPFVNLFGYTATLAAYRDGREWLEAQLGYLRDNRDLVDREIQRMPGLEIVHVEATHLAWIDARAMGARNPTRFFEEAGVGLSDGAEFDAPGFLRLNFGCSRILLREALARMARAMGGC
jgi:cystathionine beta-lyase